MIEHMCRMPHSDAGIEPFAIVRANTVLPPDDATLRMAERAGIYVARMQKTGANQFAEATQREDLKTTPLRILDLGSGTGVLGIATALTVQKYGGEISEVIAIDNDLIAAENTSTNYQRHLGNIATKVLCTDWLNPEFWKEAGDFDTIVCNPPYLAEEDHPVIRSGYEEVNKDALYMPTTLGVLATYERLISASVAASKPWAQHYFRLPKLNPNEITPLGGPSLPLKLWYASDCLANTRKTLHAKNGQIFHFQTDLFSPDNLYQTPVDTRRHMHFLAIRCVPETYPWLSGLDDIGVVHYMNHGSTLAPETYNHILNISGYPKKRTGSLICELA